ncbi:MAG: hypothetical protein ACKO3A_02230, partial [Opitutia bacterium]
MNVCKSRPVEALLLGLGLMGLVACGDGQPPATPPPLPVGLLTAEVRSYPQDAELTAQVEGT